MSDEGEQFDIITEAKRLYIEDYFIINKIKGLSFYYIYVSQVDTHYDCVV